MGAVSYWGCPRRRHLRAVKRGYSAFAKFQMAIHITRPVADSPLTIQFQFNRRVHTRVQARCYVASIARAPPAIASCRQPPHEDCLSTPNLPSFDASGTSRTRDVASLRDASFSCCSLAIVCATWSTVQCSAVSSVSKLLAHGTPARAIIHGRPLAMPSSTQLGLEAGGMYGNKARCCVPGTPNSWRSQLGHKGGSDPQQTQHRIKVVPTHNKPEAQETQASSGMY